MGCSRMFSISLWLFAAHLVAAQAQYLIGVGNALLSDSLDVLSTWYRLCMSLRSNLQSNGLLIASRIVQNNAGKADITGPAADVNLMVSFQKNPLHLCL